jgi:type IV pilus assembly protein PilA
MPHPRLAVALAAAGVIVACGRIDDPRIRAKEMAAILEIKRIHIAQKQYFSEFGKFASSLAEFGPPPPDLLHTSGRFPSVDLGKREKSGYSFELAARPGGYVIRAEPVDPAGKKFYYSNQEMVIRVNTGGRASENSPEVR